MDNGKKDWCGASFFFAKSSYYHIPKATTMKGLTKNACEFRASTSD